MSYFNATIQTKGKKVVHGIHAETKTEAMQLAKLKYKGTIIKVVPATIPLDKQAKEFFENLRKNFSKKKIKADMLIGAINQLAVMTNAGLSLNDSLIDIAKATNDPALKRILESLGGSINAGNSLSTSVKEYRYELGNLTIAMIELGEKTGQISDALTTLATMLEEIRDNVKKFKKSMAYPRNVMVAMAIAFSVLLTQVVPKFKTIFSKLGADLPLPTLILQSLSDGLVNYGVEILTIIVGSYMVFNYAIAHYDTVKYKFHWFLLHVKIIKGIILYATLSRFTLVFTELVRAGIPIVESLDTAISMIDNMVLKRKLLTLKTDVEKGLSLNEAFQGTGLFENMIIQMVTAGETGGQLDAMLGKVSDYYKMKFDTIIDTLQDAIEPIMLFIIAAMVILLALGIFMPMWGIADAAKH